WRNGLWWDGREGNVDNWLSPLSSLFTPLSCTAGKALLKAELKRRNVGYRELAEKRTAMGSPETEPNIANKISQGGFTAAFFIQCLSAVGCITLRLCGP